MLSCKTQQKSFRSISNKQIFTRDEVHNLKDIVEYFEFIFGINENNLNNSYRILIQEKSLNLDSIQKHVLDKEKFRAVINDFSKVLKNEIWITTETTAYATYEGVNFSKPILYTSFGFNINGKYIDLLKEVSKEDKSIQTYIDGIISIGAKPTLWKFNSLLVNTRENKTVNFESDYWRMIIAIQYITMLEDNYRHMELNEE